MVSFCLTETLVFGVSTQDHFWPMCWIMNFLAVGMNKNIEKPTVYKNVADISPLLKIAILLFVQQDKSSLQS